MYIECDNVEYPRNPVCCMCRSSEYPASALQPAMCIACVDAILKRQPIKYLSYPRGTVLPMKVIPDASNPKRYYCDEVRLLLWCKWPSYWTIAEISNSNAMEQLRNYYIGEGISFAFRYY